MQTVTKKKQVFNIHVKEKNITHIHSYNIFRNNRNSKISNIYKLILLIFAIIILQSFIM